MAARLLPLFILAKITEKTSIVTKKESETTENKKSSKDDSYHLWIEEEILNAEQVAEILNSSKKVVEKELREGKLTGHKRLSKWFVLKSDLIAYIRAAPKED